MSWKWHLPCVSFSRRRGDRIDRRKRLSHLCGAGAFACQPILHRHQRRLHHGAGISHLECVGRICAAAGIAADAPAVPIVVERTGVFGVNLSRVLVLDEFLHHQEHVVLALVDHDFQISLVRLLHLPVAEVDVVDAVARGEIGAHFHRVLAHLVRHAAIEGDAVGRALDDFDEVLPPLHAAHDLLRPAADGRGRIVGMQRQPDSRLFGFRNDFLQKIGDGRPHFFQRVGALVGQGRQVTELDGGFPGVHVARILAAGRAHQIVIEARPAHAGADIVGFLEVALHGAVGVPVVFDDRQPHLARRPNGGDYFFDFFIASRPAIDNVAANPDHEVAEGEAAGFEAVHLLFEASFVPGHRRPAAEQTTRWYDFTEPIPDGPTIRLMQDLAKQYHVALVVPIYEIEQAGIYYNPAAVIHNDGSFLGKYRKSHIPHVAPGFWEKFYFRPGNLGFPVFDLGFVKIGVYICYDRHFPEGARALGLAGAEIVFNPSATVAGLSEYLWKLEQPAHAVANGYFVGAINRVGTEAPWNIGEFYGQSYFCDPRGRIFAQACRDQDEVLTADLDLDMIAEVRNTWQFFRDRRPDMYQSLVKA